MYALTKERDMLRREQNRKSDSSILLKEKDEIIKAVMAEGKDFSYKFLKVLRVPDSLASLLISYQIVASFQIYTLFR